MIAKLFENLWRIIGLASESTVEASSKKRTQEALNSDDDSDEIMVLEEPLRKRLKVRHNESLQRTGTSGSTKSIWKSLKLFLPLSSKKVHLEPSHLLASTQPELDITSGADDPFNNFLSNKENMSTQKEHDLKESHVGSPLGRFQSVRSKRKVVLSTNESSSPPALDPTFRFSPSYTSTIERRPTGLGIRKRDPIKSLKGMQSNSDSILHKQLLHSGIKKPISPFLKQHHRITPGLPDRHYISKALGLSGKPPTTKESIQINEKMEYQKMIDFYTSPLTLLRPSNPFTFGRTGSSSRSSGQLLEKAFCCGALGLKPCGKASISSKNFDGKDHSPIPLTEKESSSLEHIRNLINPTSIPEVIDLTSKKNSSESTLKISSQKSPPKKSDSHESDDIIITKEIIRPFNRIKSPNSIEIQFASSRFYNSEFCSNIHSPKESRLRLEEHKAELARKSKERIERIRKETSHSKINDVSNKLKSLNLSFPTIYKEIVLEEEEVKLPELTLEIMTVVDKALRGGPASQVLANKFNIQITRKDIHTLNGLNWLNDEVINFFMNMLMERGGKSSNLPKVYAFNTFFYPKLSKMGYSSVKRWTKKVDIFGHDLLLVPVHLGVHWCLATIDIRDNVVYYYDSMSGDNHRCVQELLRYLESEHMDKKKSPYNINDWETEIVKDIPQQMNGSDCGMFSCMFAEYLSRNARISFTQDTMPYFRKRMVYEIVTQTLMQ